MTMLVEWAGASAQVLLYEEGQKGGTRGWTCVCMFVYVWDICCARAPG